MPWDYDEEEIETGGRALPGVYLAEVTSAEQRRSGAGDAMGNIGLVEANTRKFLCYDNLMLEGKGAGIGVKKALGLGVAERYDDNGKKRVRVFDVPAWVGARAVVKLVEGSYTNKSGEKKTRLEPDFDSDGFGYAPESEWAEIRAKSGEATFGGGGAADDDDIPF